MDYEVAWTTLKDIIDRSVIEGVQCGYDQPKNNKYHGMYSAYARIRDIMTSIEEKEI